MHDKSRNVLHVSDINGKTHQTEAVSKSVYFGLNLTWALCRASECFITLNKASDIGKFCGKIQALFSVTVLVMNLLIYRRKMYGNGKKNY